MDGTTVQQPQVSFSSISRTKAVKLMKHLAIAAKKQSAREGTKQELRSHLAKIKSLALKSKSHKGKLHNEMKELEEKISGLIDNESKFFVEHKKDDRVVQELRNKVNNLSVQLQSFKQLQMKLMGKEVEIEKEEKKESSEIREIESNIRKLEQFYQKLKKSKKHPAEHLKMVEQRLKSSKERLKKLKK